MHITIHILSTAIDVDEAVCRVEGYLEAENFYDYYTVLEKQAGTLDEKHAGLLVLQSKYDCKKAAEKNYENAKAQKKQSNISMAGYYYRKAGSLYEQVLTDDAIIYNIDSYDYSIPKNDEGLINAEKWFCVPVDFHM